MSTPKKAPGREAWEEVPVRQSTAGRKAEAFLSGDVVGELLSMQPTPTPVTEAIVPPGSDCPCGRYQDEPHRLTCERAAGSLQESAPIRSFATGATRDADTGKYDYEGFLDPAVLEAFAAYMHQHRHQSDGGLRASDNWQKGIPTDVYMKSLVRHLMDLWLLHRGHDVVRPENGEVVTLEGTLGGLMFNVQGIWHNALKES